VPAATVRICRPPRLCSTWRHALLWRGQNELRQTRRNKYKNNCTFFDENKPYEGRSDRVWMRPWHVHRKQWSCHGSRLSSTQLSLTCFRERYTPFWSCVLTVEFNQSTNIKVGHRMQVIQHSLASDGSALDVSDLPYEFHQHAFSKWFLCSKLSHRRDFYSQV